jgi:hypothetical protein
MRISIGKGRRTWVPPKRGQVEKRTNGIPFNWRGFYLPKMRYAIRKR